MIDVGDVYTADLNEELRRRVLVVSNSQFHRRVERVIVAPEIVGPHDEVPFPWRVQVDGIVFAVDLVRSVPLARLLHREGRAPHEAMRSVRRALLNIT